MLWDKPTSLNLPPSPRLPSSRDRYSPTRRRDSVLCAVSAFARATARHAGASIYVSAKRTHREGYLRPVEEVLDGFCPSSLRYDAAIFARGKDCYKRFLAKERPDEVFR